MQTKETTSSYADLTTQTYNVLVEAFAAANRRALDYAKSVYEITTRPYASSAVETAVRENFDRANQLMSLTVSELQSSGQMASELSSKLIAHGTKFQETYTASMRGLVDTGLSNMKFVKETATQQMDDMAKRIDEVSSHATAQVSAN
jgi:hypothetical protein